MNAVIFRILLINFDTADYQLVGNLLGEIQTFKSQRYLWSQNNVTKTIPPQGYDAYLVNDLSQQDSQIASWREANWIAKLNPAPVIVLVETPGDGMAALSAGAADYLVRQELSPPVLERSLRLTITCSQQHHSQPESWQTSQSTDGKEILSLELGLTQNQSPPVNQQSQLLIQQVANCLPQLLYIYDVKDGQNIYFNHQVIQILGYTCEQMHQGGLNFLGNLVHVDDYFVFKQLFSERFFTLADGETIETEYRVKHQNGSWRWLSCRDVVFTRDAEARSA